MTSLRLAASFAVILVSGASLLTLDAGCSSGASVHPPPPGDVDSGHVVIPEPDAQAGPAVTVVPSALSFGSGGLVDCGTQATPQTVTVTNSSDFDITWTASLMTGATNYTISPTTGGLAAGASAVVQVAPDPIPVSSAVTTDQYSGTLSITTTAAHDTAHNIPLHMTAHGVILTASVTGLNFPNIAIGTAPTQTVDVSNAGNVDAQVSYSTATSIFSVAPSTQLVAGASGTQMATVTFTPTAPQTYMDLLSVSLPTSTPNCGQMGQRSFTIPLTGSGTSGVAVSPSQLQFGPVPCGTSAPYQTVTISNPGVSTTFTPTLAHGTSYYTLTDTAGTPIPLSMAIPLAAGASDTFRVVPAAIPIPAVMGAGGYNDTLTLTTTTPGDSPHVVSLLESAQGAVFTLSVATSANTAMAGSMIFVPFTVTNTGNNTGTTSGTYSLTVATTSGPPNSFSSTSNGGALVGGAMSSGDSLILTAPGVMMQAVGRITLIPDSNDVLCADPPAFVPVSITGT